MGKVQDLPAWSLENAPKFSCSSTVSSHKVIYWVTAKIINPWVSQSWCPIEVLQFFQAELPAHGRMEEEWGRCLGYHLGGWKVTIASREETVLCLVEQRITHPWPMPGWPLHLMLKDFAIMIKKAEWQSGSNTQHGNKLNCSKFLSLPNTSLILLFNLNFTGCFTK